MSTVNSPIVFSHNDLQGGNILCRQLTEKEERIGRSSTDDSNCEGRLTVIDFEFCSYNFRAYDIANHLISDKVKMMEFIYYEFSL